MDAAPYPLALVAGMLAAVNPCGFALLPAYVSLLVIGDTKQGSSLRRMGRALALTGAMTLGFVTVFGAFGLLAAPAADWLVQRLPWVTVVIGLVLACLGLWLAAGRELPSPVPKMAQAPKLSRRFGSMVLFGVSFALASLGCTIGPFLLVVVTTFQAGSAGAGIGLFLAYAAGMALIVGVVAVAVALANQAVLRGLRRVAPMLSRAAGVLMVLAGGYVLWYGWYEIRLSRDPTARDPVIDAAGGVQTWLAAQVEMFGAGFFAVAGLVMVAVGMAVSLLRSRSKTVR
ncbi:MAG TPA: cytochrome C biogenesis protein [Micromonosporaceae bacterium]|nr:cytochrome C biogenesis protein [Micromonosporaceae bacterium]HCU51516.1 cytochrome C biogenesis protein [Micromonosporaceae bacterium]